MLALRWEAPRHFDAGRRRSKEAARAHHRRLCGAGSRNSFDAALRARRI